MPRTTHAKWPDIDYPVCVAPGQTFAWWAEDPLSCFERPPDFSYKNDTGGFVYVYPDKTTDVPPGFERVGEGRLQQFGRTGVYLAPFSKLSAADARALAHAVQESERR